MEIWIIASLAAALFQTIRFMLQKHLASGALSAVGATLARFLYSAPILIIGLGIYFSAFELPSPQIGRGFWPFVLSGSLAQIVATVATVQLFKERNFAVGVTLIKTEVLLTAIVGLAVLGDAISLWGGVAILLGVLGVMILSVDPEKALQAGAISRRAAGLGLTAGFFFAISAVTYRGATLEVVANGPILVGAITLAVATSVQTLVMVLWLAFRDAGEIMRVLKAWRVAGLIGLFSMGGSWGWFTAFALQNAAYVKAVGQIEILFSLAAGWLFFRERVTGREVFGIALMLASILGLVLGT